VTRRELAKAVNEGTVSPWEAMGRECGNVGGAEARRAVVMILLGASQRSVARSCNIHRATVKRWAKSLESRL